MTTADKNQTPSETKKRRPYREPALVEYGSISKLTQNGSGSGADGGSAGMNMVCI